MKEDILSSCAQCLNAWENCLKSLRKELGIEYDNADAMLHFGDGFPYENAIDEEYKRIMHENFEMINAIDEILEHIIRAQCCIESNL